MKITYFYQYFGTPKGGWSTRVYEMCRRWVKAGHKLQVITSLYDKSDLDADGWYKHHRIEGIDVYVVNVTLSNKHAYLYRLYTFMLYALVASYLGMRLRTDMVLASSGPLTIGIPALITKWLKRKPMVFEVRDLWPDGAIAFGIIKNPWLKRIGYWAEGLCYRNSRVVVACSEGMARSIRDRYPGTTTVTVPNAADVDLFRRRKVDDSAVAPYQDLPFFVYTGTLGLIDDCAQIVRAAAALRDKGREDIKILMIGDGKEREELEALTRSLRVENIVFLGQMPKENLIGFVRASLGSILTVKPIPFMDNCSPNKVFDAFAAGIPILQTTQGWLKELVSREGCGLNIPPNNPQAFAEAMIQLADDEAQWRAQAQQARRLGDTLFNRDFLSQKMRLAIEAARRKEEPEDIQHPAELEKAAEQ